MQLSKIHISNFRNLDGIEISFHPTNNFIVGENNLGKSNFLDLLNILFNYNSFRETDFFDVNNPVEIKFTLSLSKTEKGLFDDLFDPTNSDKINIVASQDTIDDNIVFKHQETNTVIPNNLIKCVNYINYDSLRTPNNELNFDKNKGVGKFLGHLISKYLEIEGIEDIDFIDSHKLKELLEYINGNLKKIKAFEDFSINAGLDSDSKYVLAKVITLSDSNNFSLQNVGCGIQFLSLITLTILERILNMNKTRLAKAIMQDKDGNNCMPIILGLDEPEIHLHPYMQRSLVKYLIKIIENKDKNFSELIKDIFSIDQLMGQVIISTHSPNIILNDYKQIIRFYKDCMGGLTVKSGFEINLPDRIEKHLLAQFPYIKEAFFAKCAVVVEGESELSCIPIFGEKIEIDFDEHGISIIKASAAGSIIPIMELLKSFGVQSVGIIDKDEYKRTYTDLYHTENKNFEDDIVNILISKGKIQVLKDIVCEYDSQGLDRELYEDALNKCIDSYCLSIPKVTKGYKFSDINDTDTDMVRLLYLTWLNINKNCVLGRIIGNSISKDDIPSVYTDAIKRAKELSENVG